MNYAKKHSNKTNCRFKQIEFIPSRRLTTYLGKMQLFLCHLLKKLYKIIPLEIQIEQQ